VTGPPAKQGDSLPTPEERLEKLRFFTVEGEVPLPKSLGDWMQEVEAQIAALRRRLNGLPAEYAKRGTVW
jgi:hypothetical protein